MEISSINSGSIVFSFYKFLQNAKSKWVQKTACIYFNQKLISSV